MKVSTERCSKEGKLLFHSSRLDDRKIDVCTSKTTFLSVFIVHFYEIVALLCSNEYQLVSFLSLSRSTRVNLIKNRPNDEYETLPGHLSETLITTFLKT